MCTVLKVIQNVKKYDLFRVKIAHSIHLFFWGKADLQELYLILSILKKNYPVIPNFKFAFAIIFYLFYLHLQAFLVYKTNTLYLLSS